MHLFEIQQSARVECFSISKYQVFCQNLAQIADRTNQIPNRCFKYILLKSISVTNAGSSLRYPVTSDVKLSFSAIVVVKARPGYLPCRFIRWSKTWKMDLESVSSSPVLKLDSHISTLFRRGQIIAKVSDVVRELVDNSVDAGSAKIQILLDNYGLDKIEVRDDGHGIEASQFKFAVSGGYSSKLLDSNHLSCGDEYGFRGEALSSICSFGSVTIITKTNNEPHALKYIFDNTGKIIGQSRIGNGRGTTVTVQELFSLFPVRRNFIQEKWRTVAELKEIEYYLKSVGLANPTIYMNLVHNGSSIWSKPVLKSTEEALASILGVQLAKRLAKCGPVEVQSNSQSNLITKIECYLPKVPIDPKLMTFTNNKMCIILVNRRRVHISQYEKILQQYIFGAIQSGSSQFNLKGKHPVVLLKIDTPSALADFNREIDKSKVFLQQSNSIWEELESMLKSFYPVDFNTIKENLDIGVKPNVPTLSEKEIPRSVQEEPPKSTAFPSVPRSVPPATVAPSPEVTRTQNILAFFEEIPRASDQNFSKSPAKTIGFDKRKTADSQQATAPVPDVNSIQLTTSSATMNTTASTSSSINSSALTSTAADRDWAFGRMQDTHGNVIENVSVVRRVAYNPQAPAVNIAPIPNATNQLPVQTAASDTDFFARLQTCHSQVAMTPPSMEPPSKRRRSNLVSSAHSLLQTIREQEPRNLATKRKSTPQPPQNQTQHGAWKLPPRQTTLDSFRNWATTGTSASAPRDSGNTSANSIDLPTPSPPPPPMSNLDNQGRRGHGDIEWFRGTDNLSDGIWGSLAQTMNNPPSSPAFQMMPLPVPKVLKQMEPRKPITPKRTPQPPSKVNLLQQFDATQALPTQRIHSSVMLKKSTDISAYTGIYPEDAISYSPLPSQLETPVRVVGRLTGKDLHVVKIDSLLGVFSAKNLLELAPSLEDVASSQSVRDITSGSESLNCSDNEVVRKLLEKFPNLSTDDFTEEMISRVFTLLKDLSEGNAENP